LALGRPASAQAAVLVVLAPGPPVQAQPVRPAEQAPAARPVSVWPLAVASRESVRALASDQVPALGLALALALAAGLGPGLGLAVVPAPA